MKFLQKSFLAFTLLLGLALTFSSCSKEDSTDEPKDLTPMEIIEAVQGDWGLSDVSVPDNLQGNVLVYPLYVRFTDKIAFFVSQDKDGSCRNSDEMTFAVEGDELKLKSTTEELELLVSATSEEEIQFTFPDDIVVKLKKSSSFPMPTTPEDIHEAIRGAWVRYQVNDKPLNMNEGRVFFCNFGNDMHCCWRTMPEDKLANVWSETLVVADGHLMVQGEEDFTFTFTPEGRLCMRFLDHSDSWYLKRTTVQVDVER